MGSNYSATSPEQIRSALTDLDYAILRLLPDEGAKLGFHIAKLSSSAVATQINNMQPPGAPPFKASAIGARLRGLLVGELVVQVGDSLAGHRNGWQRTPLAVQVLREQEGRSSGLDR